MSKITRLETTVTIDISESTTIGETDVKINGIIRQMAVTVPALTGEATTVTFKIEDADDIEQFSQATIAEGASTVISTYSSLNLQIPVCNTTTLQITASAAQETADKDVVVTIWYEQE